MSRAFTAVALAAACLLAGCASGTGRTGNAYADLAPEDVALASAAMQEVLETGHDGKEVGWKNGATGRSGSVKPLSTYLTSNGYFCRSYEERLRDGRRERGFRHDACRNEQGAWIWL